MLDLTELVGLEHGATPGDWDAYHEQGIAPFLVTFDEDEKGMRTLKAAVPVRGHEADGHANLRFIAAARNHCRPMINEIARLRAELGKAQLGFALIRESDDLDAIGSACMKSMRLIDEVLK